MRDAPAVPGARQKQLGPNDGSGDGGAAPPVGGLVVPQRQEIAKEVRCLVPAHLVGTVLVATRFVRPRRHDRRLLAGNGHRSAGRHRLAERAHALWRRRRNYSGYLLVAVSQSGQTPEIVDVVQRARASGARAIAITNDATRPLAHAADLVVALEAGRELAVPATKTVTAQLVAFMIIAQAVGDVGLDETVIAELPVQVAEVLADPGPAEELAQWLRHRDRLVSVARGLLYGAAQEVALKVAETTSFLTVGVFCCRPQARADRHRVRRPARACLCPSRPGQ